MAWVSVHQQIRGKKLREFYKALNCSEAEAVGILTLLWLWGIDNADETGKIIAADRDDLRNVISGSVASTVDATVAVEQLIKTHWIDEIDGKDLYFHDWDEWQKDFYRGKQERQRKAKWQRQNRKEQNSSVNSSVHSGVHKSGYEDGSPSPSPKQVVEEEDNARAREGKVFEFFQQNVGMITPFQSETIGQYLDDGLEPELIIAIMQDSQGTDNKWRWIQTVLQNSFEQGIKTAEQYDAKKVEKKARDKPAPTPTSKAEQRQKALQRAMEIANKLNGGGNGNDTS